MYWVIDESQLFIYPPTPLNTWKIVLIAGAALPYEGRREWCKRRKWVRHASSYTPSDEVEICAILQDMIECDIEAVLVVGDIGHSSKSDAEILRKELIDPLYVYADTQPAARKQALRIHLDNLLGNGADKLSLQDFFKTWSILEAIARLIQLLVGKLNKIRDVDLRKLRLLIDDQAKAALISLKNFVHFFIHCRAKELNTCPPGSSERLRRHNLRTEGGITYFDATSLIDRILVEKHGANMDDKFPELKVADLISNFSRRALQGELPSAVAEKLSKIIKIKLPLQATPNKNLIIRTPPQTQKAVELLLT